MTDNVFQPTNEEGEQPVLQAEVEKLKERGIDELAKKGAHADQLIAHLQEQNKKLAEDLAKRLDIEKTLEEIKSRQEAKVSEEPTRPGLDPADIEGLVEKKIAQQSQQTQANANLEAVNKAVVEKFGSTEKGVEFIVQKARELHTTPDELAAMAARSPKLFFNAVGFEVSSSAPGTVAKGTVNAAALSDQNRVVTGTHSYYEEMRKSNPKQYWDPKTQRQLFEDRKNKGSIDFYK